MNLKNKNILIYGLGKSGIASLNILVKYGANIFIYDKDKEKLKKYKKNSIHIYTKEYNEHLDFVIKSPGVNPNDEILQNVLESNIPIISEIEFGYNLCKSNNIVGITGTNGKTTSTELITEILSVDNKVYKCGNIGYPFCNYVDKISKKDFVVIELSSFQLENISSFKPKVALITNIAEDHLDRYSTFEDYKTAKFNICKNLQENDFLILNENLSNEHIKTNAKKYFFSTSGSVIGTYIVGNKVFFQDYEKSPIEICELEKRHFEVRHNIENILACVCVACVLNISKKSIQIAIQNFNSIEHRFERITKINGIEFVNDSKATNIHATLSAVKDVKAKVHLLLGGSDKGENFDNLFSNLPQNVQVYLFGSTTNKMVLSCLHVGFSKFKICKNMRNALENAYKSAQKNELILLSPACASFDEFRNFEERGKFFKEWVYALNDKQ